MNIYQKRIRRSCKMLFKSFRRLNNDNRCFFSQLYKRTDFPSNGIGYDYIQVNLSYSRKGALMEQHYQVKPMEQGKLVYVVSGRVHDAAVDIRRGSPWFCKHAGMVLEPRYALWIPPAFARGFQALEDTYFSYLVTEEYSPQHERCTYWDDPELKIKWPTKENVILSEKDSKCPPLKYADTDFGFPLLNIGIKVVYLPLRGKCQEARVVISRPPLRKLTEIFRKPSSNNKGLVEDVHDMLHENLGLTRVTRLRGD